MHDHYQLLLLSISNAMVVGWFSLLHAYTMNKRKCSTKPGHADVFLTHKSYYTRFKGTRSMGQ